MQAWAYYPPSHHSPTGVDIISVSPEEERIREVVVRGDDTVVAIEGDNPCRKKLELKPRSIGVYSSVTSSSDKTINRCNPFGAAKPREEVLAQKGIDVKVVDDRIQKKATTVHFTRLQHTQLENLRNELTTAEQLWREANENELPEEKYILLTEQKRKELSDLMTKFTEENETMSSNSSSCSKPPKMDEKQIGPPTSVGSQPRFERPSERRKRLEQDQIRSGKSYDSDWHQTDKIDPYLSFGGRRWKE